MNPIVPFSYDYRIVALSTLVSVMAAYAAHGLTEQISEARGVSRLRWLTGGALVDGLSTWSMHYTAMLALRISIPVRYYWPTVLLSYVVGVAGSAVALSVISARGHRWWRIVVASIALGGVGISAMHFIAMKAMRQQAMHEYSAVLVMVSVTAAIVISFAGLAVQLFNPKQRTLQQHGGVLLRGCANPVMHYIAMAAMTFRLSREPPDFLRTVRIETIGVLGISIVPVMVLVVAILTSFVGRLQRQRTLLDHLFEQAPQAVSLLTVAGRIVRVNREFSQLFGYTAQEAVGRHIQELIEPEDTRDGFGRYAEAGSGAQRLDAETVRRRKDGSRLQAYVVGVPVHLAGNERVIYEMYMDITQRKEADAALQTVSSRLLAVQESERKHLARELHDEIGQLLTGLRLMLNPKNSDADVRELRLEHARAIVDDLLGRVRRLSFDLRPADLDQFGLLPALLAFFDRFTEQTGLLVDFKHNGMERRFASELETAAYRIVQEALTNVARHAGVAGVIVRAWTDHDMLTLRIEDRGHGFDPESVWKNARSSGLSGVRERAILLGGRLMIDSEPGSGTTITAELPLLDGRQSESENKGK